MTSSAARATAVAMAWCSSRMLSGQPYASSARAASGVKVSRPARSPATCASTSARMTPKSPMRSWSAGNRCE